MNRPVEGDQAGMSETESRFIPGRWSLTSVVPPPLVTAGTFSKRLVHFLHFELDQGRVGVSVSVVFDEESERLLSSTVGKQPSRRL